MRIVWWMLFSLMMGVGVGQSMDVRVFWDANEENDVAGYWVYWGNTPGQYPWRRYVGQATRCDMENLDDNVRYYISVTAIDYWGNESSFSNPVVAASGELPEVPENFTLSKSYPNPFTQDARMAFFNFNVPESRHVDISIYNLLGQKIAELVKGDFSPGPYKTQWNGLDRSGQFVPAGTYFCILNAGEITLKRKITLIR